MPDVKPIVCVTPHAFTPALREALQAAGYAVIVSARPDEIQVIDVVPIAAIDVITRSALEAIQKPGIDVGRAFGQKLAANMLAKPAPTEGE